MFGDSERSGFPYPGQENEPVDGGHQTVDGYNEASQESSTVEKALKSEFADLHKQSGEVRIDPALSEAERAILLEPMVERMLQIIKELKALHSEK